MGNVQAGSWQLGIMVEHYVAYKLAPPLLLIQVACLEEEGALKEVSLVVAFHTLDALEVALSVEVACHKDPLEEGLAGDLHTS